MSPSLTAHHGWAGWGAAANPQGWWALSVSPHQAGALLAHTDVPLVMGGDNKRHCYCARVLGGVNLLQLSPKVPTAQRPGSCWSYLL